jgi:hypothetical protein
LAAAGDRATLERRKPKPKHATHWSARMLAAESRAVDVWGDGEGF